jgi:hypothetical protein
MKGMKRMKHLIEWNIKFNSRDMSSNNLSDNKIVTDNDKRTLVLNSNPVTLETCLRPSSYKESIEGYWLAKGVLGSLKAPVVGQRRGNADLQDSLEMVEVIAVPDPSSCLYSAET